LPACQAVAKKLSNFSSTGSITGKLVLERTACTKLRNFKYVDAAFSPLDMVLMVAKEGQPC
jgi:hypothetical protein